MKLKYKSSLFLTLFIFCIGSVCAVPIDNNIDNVTTNQTLNNHTNGTQKIDYGDKVMELMKKPHTKLHNQTEKLNESNKQQNIDFQDLKNKIWNLSTEIIKLKDINTKVNNKINTNANEIQQLKEDNKALNEKINKQNTEIQELKDKLGKNSQINQDKDKINKPVTNQNIKKQPNKKQIDKKKQPNKNKQHKKVKNKRRHKKRR